MSNQPSVAVVSPGRGGRSISSESVVRKIARKPLLDKAFGG